MLEITNTSHSTIHFGPAFGQKSYSLKARTRNVVSEYSKEDIAALVSVSNMISLRTDSEETSIDISKSLDIELVSTSTEEEVEETPTPPENEEETSEE